MANDKKFVVKNGLQAQNASLISPDETNTIALTMLDSDTLSFSGDAGQLFSITDTLTGTIFAVNDISGIPSIEVDDTGVIRLAEFDGNVLIGTAVDDGANKLQVAGTLKVTDTTNDGVSLNTITQLGTGRALYVTRNVASATRALANFVQTSATGGTNAVVDIQQNTVASDALRITSDGSTVTASITGDGNATFAGTLTGATSKFSVDNTGSVQATDILLSAISDTSITSTATDVFVYDTSQDSDGGAWRERTSHTSWYNETLDTASRGSTREFPAVALIVTTATNLTIYDADDDKLPMWMVFDFVRYAAGSNYIDWPYGVGSSNGAAGDTDLSSVAMLNGRMFITSNHTDIAWGAWDLDFITEDIYEHTRHPVTASQTGKSKTLGTIATRNSTASATVTARYLTAGNTGGIVSSPCNDCAITVLPDAPIDASTGLPTPTIAVATDGGVSVITDGGDVWDLESTNASSTRTEAVYFTDGQLTFWHSDSFNLRYTGFSIVELPTADGVYGQTTREYASGSAFPSLTPYDTTTGPVSGYVSLAYGNTFIGAARNNYGAYGFAKVSHIKNSSTTSMVVGITSLYNTGWMQGDIKGAWLSSTTAETLGVDESVELVANGTAWTGATGTTEPTSWSNDGTLQTYTIIGSDDLQIQRSTEANAADAYLYQTITTVADASYELSIDLVAVVTGSLSVIADGISMFTAVTALTTYTYSFVASTASTLIQVLATNSISADITIDNLSVKRTGNLIENGTFDNVITGWTGSNATLSVVSNALRITAVANGAMIAEQVITTVVGERYVAQVESVADATTGVLNFNVATSTGGNNILTEVITTLGSYTFTFTATTTTTYIIVAADGGALLGETADFDNISVRLADDDRSVNDNGLEVHGEITKAVVATGAELVGYSGFSGTNYLEQPYNADLDFGTGDFHVMGWVSMSSVPADVYLFHRRDPADTGAAYYMRSISGTYSFLAGTTASFSSISSVTVYPINTWQYVVGLRNAGVLYLYIDGILIGSIAETDNLDSAAAVLTIGSRVNHTQTLPGSMALWRVGAGAPTAAQIEEIYQTEKFMFQDNANCTLDGASDAITAMGYDDKTELLHVSTPGGRSTFKDLVRVESDTAADSQSLTAISSQDGFLAEGK